MPAHRPAVLLGNGARGADIECVLSWGVPVLTSWQAKDMLDNAHPLYFGSPGIYGQRCANAILTASDSILALGNRMSIWNVGYASPRPDQQLSMVDLAEEEAFKFPGAVRICMDCADFVDGYVGPGEVGSAWRARCEILRERWPLHEPEPGTHDDTAYINSYRFVHRLQRYLAPDDVIVTEMGAALCSAHQMLCIKPPQRLMTSGGLGEMGCGLPAAVGASFARSKGRVLCLSTDGGMMMNLQELQTIVHHNLPVKIIVFNNAGYGMLRETQRNAGMRFSGINERTGVSFPNFRHVAMAFGISAAEVRTWEDFERIVPSVMQSTQGPFLIDYIMDPEQKLQPKLGYSWVDGQPKYDRFEEMSPHA